MSANNRELLTGLLIGGLIGAALGILYAPKSGKDTRDDITGKAKDFLAKTKEEYEKAVERSKSVYDAAVKHLKCPDISEKYI